MSLGLCPRDVLSAYILLGGFVRLAKGGESKSRDEDYDQEEDQEQENEHEKELIGRVASFFAHASREDDPTLKLHRAPGPLPDHSLPLNLNPPSTVALAVSVGQTPGGASILSGQWTNSHGCSHTRSQAALRYPPSSASSATG